MLTAALSLILPIAVRRVVDTFNGVDAHLLNAYFGAALGIATLLALGTGTRYYLVTRLGERVVADIRRALFDRVIGLSPAFFEKIELGSHLTGSRANGLAAMVKRIQATARAFQDGRVQPAAPPLSCSGFSLGAKHSC